MTSISAKIIEAFRNLRSDAVPRDPRPPSSSQATPDDVTGDTHNESEATTNNPEEIHIGPDDAKEDRKPKKKHPFGKSKKKNDSNKPTNPKSNGAKVYNVNTQANGSVITVLESPGFRLGNDFVYYLGPTQHNRDSKTSENINPEEHIEKTNEVTLLMEAKIPPEHEYINYISENLGKNWHSFFKKLGYTKGRIETFEIDEFRNGVKEARYKLLLDWMRNDDDGTLGRLATVLWAEGERQIVKELSIIYSTNNKI